MKLVSKEEELFCGCGCKIDIKQYPGQFGFCDNYYTFGCEDGEDCGYAQIFLHADTWDEAIAIFKKITRYDLKDINDSH